MIEELRIGDSEANQKVAAAKLATILGGGGVVRTTAVGSPARSWNSERPNWRELEPLLPKIIPKAESQGEECLGSPSPLPYILLPFVLFV